MYLRPWNYSSCSSFDCCPNQFFWGEVFLRLPKIEETSEKKVVNLCRSSRLVWLMLGGGGGCATRFSAVSRLCLTCFFSPCPLVLFPWWTFWIGSFLIATLLTHKSKKKNEYCNEIRGHFHRAPSVFLGRRFLYSCNPPPPPPLSLHSFYVIYGRSVMSTQMLEVSLLGVRTVLRLERNAWSMVK